MKRQKERERKEEERERRKRKESRTSEVNKYERNIERGNNDRVV